MQSRRETEAAGKLAEVVTEGHATTSNPKSQNDPNQNVNSPLEPASPQPNKAAAKRQPTHNCKAPAEPKLKCQDKSSLPRNPLTKRKQVAKLVGKKCLVWFKMNNIKTQALWDTGAQVSIMSETWKSKNLPDAKILPISDLLSDDELLDLRAANGSEIPFQGWVEVNLSLYDPKTKTPGSDEILVPVLVSRDIIQRPIIGFNAIEEIMRDREDQVQPSDRVALLRNSLRLGTGKAEALLNLIQGATNENVTYTVKTGGASVVVSGRQTKCISCPVKTNLKANTEVIFEPEENLSLNEELKITCQLVNISCSSRRVDIYVRNTTQSLRVIPKTNCGIHL